MNKKYMILVGDGMADFSIPELDNKTPLEHAGTPNMDYLASIGQVGLVSTVPDGFAPGSDVANLSLMGYNPAEYYSGRAPFEAASLGIQLTPNETAFRCNLVEIHKDIMADYSAGHIETDHAHKVIELLKDELDSDRIRFYPGISYRHLLVIKDFPEGLQCTPPHDISDRAVKPYLPQGPGADFIQEIMLKAREILTSEKAQQLRRKIPALSVTDIWLWGQGHAVSLPKLEERYGLTGSVISAVDLVRGLGSLAGLKIRIVPGATGYLGTNYAGKVAAAQSALEKEDFVYLHVEAPDETSHQGSLQKKIQAIEEFDTFVVGPMIDYQKKNPSVRILVAPDHATPVSLKTHSAGPVPFVIAGSGVKPDGSTAYCEKSAEIREVITGPELFCKFIKGF